MRSGRSPRENHGMQDGAGANGDINYQGRVCGILNPPVTRQ
jgi:hypothetical protein